MAQRRAMRHVESGAGWAEVKPRLLDTQLSWPRAILAAVEPTHQGACEAGPPWSVTDSLEELARLAHTGQIEVVRKLSQRLPSAHPRTYFGEGKMHELAGWLEAEKCEIAVFDDELSPSQQKGIEAIIGAGKVVDRTQLILDIFAARAHTREGVLQVRLAQAQYQIPRLRRLWTHLERQRGGTGTRGGAGETQMETDRRALQGTVKRLERELESVRARRSEQRRSRHEKWPTAALVGYTNAGKSTLLNALTGATVGSRDQLFATLDPTTRKWSLGSDGAALLTDTVGFIHKLPATLVAAFRATLEEAIEADLLLHVIDASSRHAAGQATVVVDELEQIGARAPIVTVLNKIDLIPADERSGVLADLRATFPDAVAVSAISKDGLSGLAAHVRDALPMVAGRFAPSASEYISAI
jgi:GTP-binding protein HflX